MGSYAREGHMLESRMIELYKTHAGISISQDISDFENVDCHIYTESTADGYDVYVCTNNTRHVSICEDVYYYDNDLTNAFEEQIRYGDRTFYIDDYVYEDCYFDDKLVELFVEYIDDIIADAEDGNSETDITPEEIEYLKEEYGIEEETEEADSTKVV